MIVEAPDAFLVRSSQGVQQEMEGGGGVYWHVFGQKKPGGKGGRKRPRRMVGVETSDASLVRRNQRYGDS